MSIKTKKPTLKKSRGSNKIVKKKLDVKIEKTHNVWLKFSNWIVKTFGKDLHGEWKFTERTDENGKKFRFKYRSFNDLELSRRLVGYDAMCKVEKFVKRCCPEIKIIRCDDSIYAGSDILLIPHPNHGISVIFIPQCTQIQNEFFLYKNHHKELVKALKEMGTIYAKDGF